MTWNYQIFKFTTHDWEGKELSPIRKGAPLYGLFEVSKNEKDEIWGRNENPELIVDSFLEEKDDPVTLFKEQLIQMLNDIELPILKEPYNYAEVDSMTDEEVELLMAGKFPPEEQNKE